MLHRTSESNLQGYVSGSVEKRLVVRMNEKISSDMQPKDIEQLDPSNTE